MSWFSWHHAFQVLMGLGAALLYVALGTAVAGVASLIYNEVRRQKLVWLVISLWPVALVVGVCYWLGRIPYVHLTRFFYWIVGERGRA